jgi:hypothetical protein
MVVWLKIGGDSPVKVQTRKLCRDGILLEYAGTIDDLNVEVIFPDGGSTGSGKPTHYAGTVVQRWTDGIWVQFNPNLRSASELLMRHGTSRRGIKPAQTLRQRL